MKKRMFLLLLICYSIEIVHAQNQVCNDLEMGKAVIQSGIIHSPLALDNSNSYETNGLKKKVLLRMPLTGVWDFANWKHSGIGKISFSEDKTTSGKGSIKMEYPTYTGKRAQGSASDPDYATYGNSSASFNVNGEDWEKYNRIVFHIFPHCKGARVVNINFSIENHSDIIKAGYNRQSGEHLVNLINNQWNTCFLDMDEYQRNNIIKIDFNVSLKGKDITTGDSAVYYIDEIELQQIENPEKVKGWMPDENKVVYSTSGYMPDYEKTAIVKMNNHNNSFQLINSANNRLVYTGTISRSKTTTGEYDVIDFSSINEPGSYQLKVGDVTTPPFRIGENVWGNSLWKTLNFVFCQRCGYPVPGKHGTCHVDLFSEHAGEKKSFAGGWHDAGDLSQQTLQTGDVTYTFFEAYNKYKDKNPVLANRMLEEAQWGLDFILKNRYGDGYRASSVGLLIWQDGLIGSIDDISTVRVQNMAFDNFLYAAYEAYAAMSINNDPMFKEYLIEVAKKDFEFAVRRDTEVGFGEFYYFYEHSYNTSQSQYMASASWSASMLYQLTGDSYYAKKAIDFINYTLACQRREPLGDKSKIKGFFYRNKSKKVIVHYNHQSREQIYMQAMELLCKTQPHHPDYQKWETSIQLYGSYLKSLMQYTAPYGMLASGVYHIDENKDDVSFNHLHLFIPPDAKQNYEEQLKRGIQLDDEHYLKRFPVWFSIFNGNTAVHLSMGKAAAICGKFLHDKELLGIGLEQLYWVVGKNPFGQSLIYGEGHNYPQMDNFSSGEAVGEMPVGIRTLGNEDIPYWPQTNTSCYKEVWVTSAGKWISLASEY